MHFSLCAKILPTSSPLNGMKTPLFGIMIVIVTVILTLLIFHKSHWEYNREGVETVTHKRNMKLVYYLRYMDCLRICI